MSPLRLSGMDDSETIRINRGGGADPEGDLPGDLYVKLKVIYKFPKSNSHK